MEEQGPKKSKNVDRKFCSKIIFELPNFNLQILLLPLSMTSSTKAKARSEFS